MLGLGSALAIAADGTAAGVAYHDDGAPVVRWRNGAEVDVNDLIDAGTGWRLERAEAISDDG